jgi:hypothetical protein
MVGFGFVAILLVTFVSCLIWYLIREKTNTVAKPTQNDSPSRSLGGVIGDCAAA